MTPICMSRAPIDRLTAYKRRMGWQFPYVSTYNTDFAFDFGLALTEKQALAAFVFGYLLVWAAAGLVPLTILQALNHPWMTPPSWLPRVGGAVIILAGVYQFTALKDVCLKACRSPLGFLLSHNLGRGTALAMRTGASHGLYCLGCCWALMAVLAVLGLMNVVWMAVIAAVFFIEKNVRFGDVVARVAGGVCIVGGVAAMAFG